MKQKNKTASILLNFYYHRPYYNEHSYDWFQFVSSLPNTTESMIWTQSNYFGGDPKHHKSGNRDRKSGKRMVIKYVLTSWIPQWANGMQFHWVLYETCLRIIPLKYKKAGAFSTASSFLMLRTALSICIQALPDCSHVYHLCPTCFHRKD